MDDAVPSLFKHVGRKTWAADDDDLPEEKPAHVAAFVGGGGLKGGRPKEEANETAGGDVESVCNICETALVLNGDEKEHFLEFHIHIQMMYRCEVCSFIDSELGIVIEHMTERHCKKVAGQQRCKEERRDADEDEATRAAHAALFDAQGLVAVDDFIEDIGEKVDLGIEYIIEKSVLKTELQPAATPAVDLEFCAADLAALEPELRGATIDALTCPDCGKLFRSRRCLYGHRKEKHDSLPLKSRVCGVCGKRFNRQSNLKAHYGNAHPDAPPFVPHESKSADSGITAVCDVCGKSMPKNKIKAHMKYHGPNPPKWKNFKKWNIEMTCEVCGKVVFRRSMKGHMETHQDRECRCPQCDKVLKNEDSLKQHIKLVHLKIPKVPVGKTYDCEQCGAKYPRSDALLEHQRLKHLNMKFIMCRICGAKSFREDYLDDHKCKLADHCYPVKSEDGEVVGLKCKLCEKVYKTHVGLKAHINSAHKGKDKKLLFREKPYVPCEVCGKSVFKFYMKTHVETVHNKTDPCEICGKVLSGKRQMLRHMKVKHGADYSCQLCSFVAKDSSGLTRHTNHSHKGSFAFDFVCELCDKTFSIRDSLNKHKERYHGLASPSKLEAQIAREKQAQIARQEQAQIARQEQAQIARQEQAQIVRQEQVQIVRQGPTVIEKKKTTTVSMPVIFRL